MARIKRSLHRSNMALSAYTSFGPRQLHDRVVTLAAVVELLRQRYARRYLRRRPYEIASNLFDCEKGDYSSCTGEGSKVTEQRVECGVRDAFESLRSCLRMVKGSEETTNCHRGTEPEVNEERGKEKNGLEEQSYVLEARLRLSRVENEIESVNSLREIHSSICHCEVCLET